MPRVGHRGGSARRGAARRTGGTVWSALLCGPGGLGWTVVQRARLGVWGWGEARPATTSQLWLPTFWQRPRPILMGEVHRLGTTETDVVVAVVRRVSVAVGGAHVRRVVVVPGAPAKHARAVSQVSRAPVIRQKPPGDEGRWHASAGAGCVSSHRSFGRSPGCYRRSARAGLG